MEATTTKWDSPEAGEDIAARNATLVPHLRLVKHVASQVMRSTPADLDFDDLVGAGTIGLMHAADSFDPSRGLAFSTFAAPRIRGSILDDLRRRDHASRSQRRKQRSLARTREQLSSTLERTASDIEVAKELDIDLNTLWQWEREGEHTARLSLAQPVDQEEGPTLEETILGEDGQDIEHRVNAKQEIQLMRDAILGLKEQERTVLSLYYFEELKLHEIATVLGVTESRVSQIRSKALASLRGSLSYLRDAA